MLAVGLYGETLPNQNGAPIRLVVPWKYGFKGIKSIVKIALRREAAPDHLEPERSRKSTASIRTSIPKSTIRAGAKPPSGASAISAPQDPNVQRLRRTGGESVQRHGLKKILLMKWKMNNGEWKMTRAGRILHSPFSILHFLLFIACLIPFGKLAHRAYTGDLGVNPIETITRFTGSWALIFLLTCLAVTPLRRITAIRN